MQKQLLEMAQKQTENGKCFWYHMVTLCPSLMKLPLTERDAQAVHHPAVNTETVIFPPACNSLSLFFSTERKSKASRKQIQHHAFF